VESRLDTAALPPADEPPAPRFDTACRLLSCAQQLLDAVVKLIRLGGLSGSTTRLWALTCDFRLPARTR
jgi:hypothetical protein